MITDYEEYMKICEENAKLFEKEDIARRSRKCFETDISFSIKNGFRSSIDKLVKYTLSKDITWSFSKSASYFDEDDKRFTITFISNTLCIMELRGKKKQNSIVYSGYIQVNKNNEFEIFHQWKDVYTTIIANNDYFLIKNLLQKVKHKPPKLKERNWDKITNEKSADAIALEKRIQKYRQPNIYRPITYQKFLFEKYGIKYENIDIIQKIDERKIERYVHFTNVLNLDSILEKGLIPIEQLKEQGIEYISNDRDRWDQRLDANSLSISTPNYQMFYHYKRNAPESKWVVISYYAKMVADMDCAYFATNAASSLYLERAWKENIYLKSFESMFVGQRDNLFSYETTNPQAEVMVKGTIPTNYIEAVFFDDYSLLKKYKEKYPHINMVYDKSYFLPRRDFSRWSKGYSL